MQDRTGSGKEERVSGFRALLRRPFRLSTQLIMVTVIAICATAILLSVLFYFRAAQLEYRMTQSILIERLSIILESVENGAEPQMERILESNRWRWMRISLSDEALIDEKQMSADERDYVTSITRELSLEDNDLRIMINPVSDYIYQQKYSHRKHDRYSFMKNREVEEWRGGAGHAVPTRSAIDFSLKIKNGPWINGRIFKPFSPTTRLSFSFISVLCIGGLSILLGMLFTIRSIIRPMRSLAEAAEKIGIGENIQPLREEGPKEIKETIAAFNSMYARLNAFIEDRTRMLAAISHDLRTPLTALGLRAEMLEESEEKEAIIRIVSTMTQMVEATLDFSRDDVTREIARSVDMAALVNGIVDDFEEMGCAVRLTEGFPDHLVSSCRSVSMTRAVTNLIRNAVHYGKNVDVSLLTGSEDYSIIVEDDGPGIPDERMQDVFKPFVRLDEARDVEGGSGLGLSIVNSVVMAHGGTIRLSNRETGGLRAEIILPLNTIESRASKGKAVFK